MAHQIVNPFEQQMRFAPLRSRDGFSMLGFEILQLYSVGCHLLIIENFDRKIVSISIELLDGVLTQEFGHDEISSLLFGITACPAQGVANPKNHSYHE